MGPRVLRQPPHGPRVRRLGPLLDPQLLHRLERVLARARLVAEQRRVERRARVRGPEVRVQALFLVERRVLGPRGGRHLELLEVVQVRLQLLDAAEALVGLGWLAGKVVGGDG